MDRVWYWPAINPIESGEWKMDPWPTEVRVKLGGTGHWLSGSGPSDYFESELKHKMKIEIKTQRTKRSQNPEKKEITTQIT